MKNNSLCRRFGGFLFTAISGTLLHFLYDWTGQCILIAPFSAVNESIWEHMKLLFVPLLVYAFLSYKKRGKKNENFWCIQLLTILLGVLLIPALYYTYTGALGVEADWFNIVIYYICAAVVFLVQNRLFNAVTTKWFSPATCVFVLLLIGFFFVVFTFMPPKLPLFQDPLNGTFGV